MTDTIASLQTVNHSLAWLNRTDALPHHYPYSHSRNAKRLAWLNRTDALPHHYPYSHSLNAKRLAWLNRTDALPHHYPYSHSRNAKRSELLSEYYRFGVVKPHRCTSTPLSLQPLANAKRSELLSGILSRRYKPSTTVWPTRATPSGLSSYPEYYRVVTNCQPQFNVVKPHQCTSTPVSPQPSAQRHAVWL
ncbi:hypothetical protein J6590_003402 [Homalodisca vitripennis]|nr:hypothetical protein J6590_003402 [Homalodisca vitripennis]